MHNYKSIGQFDQHHWRTNSPVLEEYVDFNSYNIWIPATAFVESAGGLIWGTVNGSPYVELPAGIDTTLVYALRKPRMWGQGFVSANVWYTGNLVANKHAVVALGILPKTVGEALVVPTDSANNLIPSPTANNVLSLYTGFTSVIDGGNVEITDSDHFVTLNITRYGTDIDDGYTATIKLLGLELIYVEKRHQFQYRKVDSINRSRTVNR